MLLSTILYEYPIYEYRLQIQYSLSIVPFILFVIIIIIIFIYQLPLYF